MARLSAATRRGSKRTVLYGKDVGTFRGESVACKNWHVWELATAMLRNMAAFGQKQTFKPLLSHQATGILPFFLVGLGHLLLQLTIIKA